MNSRTPAEWTALGDLLRDGEDALLTCATEVAAAYRLDFRVADIGRYLDCLDILGVTRRLADRHGIVDTALLASQLAACYEACSDSYAFIVMSATGRPHVDECASVLTRIITAVQAVGGLLKSSRSSDIGV